VNSEFSKGPRGIWTLGGPNSLLCRRWVTPPIGGPQVFFRRRNFRNFWVTVVPRALKGEILGVILGPPLERLCREETPSEGGPLLDAFFIRGRKCPRTPRIKGGENFAGVSTNKKTNASYKKGRAGRHTFFNRGVLSKTAAKKLVGPGNGHYYSPRAGRRFCVLYHNYSASSGRKKKRLGGRREYVHKATGENSLQQPPFSLCYLPGRNSTQESNVEDDHETPQTADRDQEQEARKERKRR